MAPTAQPQASGFDQDERRFLVSIPGIGPGVVDRLESVGLASLDALRQAGVDQAVLIICMQQGTHAWKNRRRALARALHQFLAKRSEHLA